MHVCGNCPDNPDCQTCVEQLGVGQAARKVLPPRPISIVHLLTGTKVEAELRVVSRLVLGVYAETEWKPGRYELELAADFRIIASTVGAVHNASYIVLDIEQVLRKEDMFDRLLLDEFHSWQLSQELQPECLLTNDEQSLDSERKEMIVQELKRLSILRKLREVHMYVWEHDSVKPLGESQIDLVAQEEINRLARQALKERRGKREQSLSAARKRLYDLHVFPFDDNTCGVAVIDITDAIAMERERNRQQWEFCRDVVALVTKGKLQLIDEQGLFEVKRQGERKVSCKIACSADLGVLRKAIREQIAPFGISGSSVLHFTVAVNEAATNALSHAGGGVVEVNLLQKDEYCRIIVTDHGRGISLADLPKAALQPGFSTNNTLGLGFQVMLQYADMIWLHSSSKGTTIVLDYALQARVVQKEV
ncbi:ATP-binding protein [Brevibacillus migulae]|uniref:ATP-binding protein n=1 Tax=Brevibacillus migulae TaxID=1644114 RepID=UPI00142F8286|nr:ATP-binding protein [Brevibacillus migulae]